MVNFRVPLRVGAAITDRESEGRERLDGCLGMHGIWQLKIAIASRSDSQQRSVVIKQREERYSESDKKL